MEIVVKADGKYYILRMGRKRKTGNSLTSSWPTCTQTSEMDFFFFFLVQIKSTEIAFISTEIQQISLIHSFPKYLLIIYYASGPESLETGDAVALDT